ncbi:hypothetical protein [Labilithrix luteola]|nr:hypothetical protein [Labilithrix luteola]
MMMLVLGCGGAEDSASVAEDDIQSKTIPTAEIAELLERHGVPKMRTEIGARAISRHDQSSVGFLAALDSALTLFLENRIDGLPSVIRSDELDVYADKCPGTTGKGRRAAALCVANRPKTRVRLVPVDAQPGSTLYETESPVTNWLFEFQVTDLSDGWFYAWIPNDGRRGAISGYN